ncbi:putative alcohol dehydrogenase [Lyophyllum shimeji]|uniref:Alcohol dehydrogenase n=1 Tax=Lyophyllum shimeji TaxID=47721 RepID=A0A9P3PTY0_LYOSH|nr:putative alcohol dehydrogenase [Lyophyllum shimeji]
MTIPNSAREYFLPKLDTYDNLVIRTKEVARPRANEVLVKVRAVSLQYRDLVIAKGDYPIGGSEVVPCSDMAGEIVEVGSDVKGWKAGDRVCANFSTDHIHGDPTAETLKTSLGGQSPGVLTEYRTFPAHSLVSIPSHLSYQEASTLPCAALTAYNALHGPVPVKAGDYVLVLGTGGVSIFGLQLALASGAVVIATSSSDEKLKVASKLGAKHVINYNRTPNWDEEILKITNNRGVDHVIEVGGQGSLPKSINAARYGGYLHLIGFLAQGESDTATLVLSAIRKAVSLRGILIGSVAQYVIFLPIFRAKHKKADHPVRFVDMNRLLSANPEVTRPVVDKVFPFEEAKQAYAYLASQAHVGKVVIKVSKD